MTRRLLLIRVAIRYILLHDQKTGRDPVSDTSYLLTGYTRRAYFVHASYILYTYTCATMNRKIICSIVGFIQSMFYILFMESCIASIVDEFLNKPKHMCFIYVYFLEKRLTNSFETYGMYIHIDCIFYKSVLNIAFDFNAYWLFSKRRFIIHSVPKTLDANISETYFYKRNAGQLFDNL